MKVRLGFILLVLALVALGVLAWMEGSGYLVNGHFRRSDFEEKLDSPVQITGWTAEGLHLASGRTVQLPGFRNLPVNSTALTEATKRGIELGADGRIYGLMLIHHWCGNDPVRRQLARVDIAWVLKFLQEGEWTQPLPEDPGLRRTFQRGGMFTKWGWNISEYYSFRSWQGVLADLEKD